MSRKHEQRSRTDRRQDEIGPPSGWKDRRRRTERRIPEIDEQEVSESEWLSYFGHTAKVVAVTDSLPAHELAADVLERARE